MATALSDRLRRRVAGCHRTVGAAAVVLVIALMATPFASAASGDESADQQPERLLILPFDMVDSSLQGEMNHGPLEADVARLRRTADILRRSLGDRDEFELVDPDSVSEKIEEAASSYRYLYECNGCQIDLGKAADADLVMTGWVQKVSNLILNINATLYDVDTGQSVGGGSVDMRSNTNKSWRAAGLYLVEHAMLENYHSRQRARAAAETTATSQTGEQSEAP